MNTMLEVVLELWSESALVEADEYSSRSLFVTLYDAGTVTAAVEEPEGGHDGLAKRRENWCRKLSEREPP